MEKTRKTPTAAPTPADRRRVLMGLAHKGAKLLGLDDDTRRAAQANHTGVSSCRDMSDGQLLAWCWELKHRGAKIGIPGPAPRAVAMDRPSVPQLAEIERLAGLFGWTDGLDDRRLLGFVQHTAKVDHPRFMTRAQATAVISGLMRWQKGRAAA